MGSHEIDERLCLIQHAQWYFPFPCNDDLNGLGIIYNMAYNFSFDARTVYTNTNRVGLLDGLLDYSQGRQVWRSHLLISQT